jgi:hypothetical protein
MLVWLQTAAQRRLPSPVQAEQGPPAPGDRTQIVRFSVGAQVEAVTLRCAHRQRRMFAVLLPPPLASMVRRGRPHGRTSEVFLR